MTVAELIAILEDFNPDALVMVNGYESGLKDLTPSHVYSVPVVLSGNNDNYGGPHELRSRIWVDDDEPEPQTIRAVILSRYERDEED